MKNRALWMTPSISGGPSRVGHREHDARRLHLPGLHLEAVHLARHQGHPPQARRRHRQGRQTPPPQGRIWIRSVEQQIGQGDFTVLPSSLSTTRRRKIVMQPWEMPVCLIQYKLTQTFLSLCKFETTGQRVPYIAQIPSPDLC